MTQQKKHHFYVLGYELVHIALQVDMSIIDKYLNKENEHGRGEESGWKMPSMRGRFRVIRATGVDSASLGLGRFQALSVYRMAHSL
jgi:hypothetical protein